MALPIWSQLLHFKPSEFGANADAMQPELLRRLDRMRALAGIPIKIGSNYRAGDPLAHGRGHAVDIPCTNSRTRMRLVAAAMDAGFRRIGIYDRHVHVDTDASLPQNVLWHGVSK